MSNIRFDVIVDTREQKNLWSFANYDEVESVIEQKLDTGDYTIAGLEDRLCIERKHSISELANNITEKRFERELERMSQFPHSFLVLEFGLDDVDNYPNVSCIPRKIRNKIKIRGPYIFKKLAEISIIYGVSVIPCGHPKYAEAMVVSLMKRVYEQNYY